MKIVVLLIALQTILFVNKGVCQWVQMSSGIQNGNIPALLVTGNKIFAGTQGNGVYLSVNDGLSWTQTSLNSMDIWAFAANGNNIFAGTGFEQGVYYSPDGGTSWSQTSLNNLSIYSLTTKENYVYAGTITDGIYISQNNGSSWIIASNSRTFSLASNGNIVFAGGTGVSYTPDNGISWISTPLNDISAWSLATNSNRVFAGGWNSTDPKGVYVSLNNGLNWTQTSLNDQYVYSIAVNGNNIFAGTYNNGVFVSNDNGLSWAQRNEGMGNVEVQSLVILNGFIFAGTVSDKIYRRPLNEITGINPASNTLPAKYNLHQNYPNPFNPSTKIKFDLPRKEFINLSIYDITGRIISVLVNYNLTAGTYEVDWNAQELPSGVFYYALYSNNNLIETKKMIYLK